MSMREYALCSGVKYDAYGSLDAHPIYAKQQKERMPIFEKRTYRASKRQKPIHNG